MESISYVRFVAIINHGYLGRARETQECIRLNPTSSISSGLGSLVIWYVLFRYFINRARRSSTRRGDSCEGHFRVDEGSILTIVYMFQDDVCRRVFIHVLEHVPIPVALHLCGLFLRDQTRLAFNAIITTPQSIDIALRYFQ